MAYGILLSLLMVFIYGFGFISGPPITTTSTTFPFYSDFNAADDADWGSLPSGWDDDYATSPAPLEGAQSLYTSTGNTYHYSDAFTTQTGTVYARAMFRADDFTSETSGNGLRLELASGTTSVAQCYVWWDGNDNRFESIKADDGSSYTEDLGSDTDLNDASYFIQLIYIPGTSVNCTIRDSGNNAYGGYNATHSTAQNSSVDTVAILPGSSLIKYIVDTVEVRVDTDWGTE